MSSLVPITKKELSLQIISVEAGGFLVMTVLLWCEEIFDLPHYWFGAEKTPVNIIEAITDSVMLFSLALIVLFATHKLLKRIRHLEGFLHVCSFCKRVQVDNQWHQMEDYISTNSAALFSHTVCPSCAEKHYGDFIYVKK